MSFKKSFSNLFKTKDEKHKEFLQKQYDEGKVLEYVNNGDEKYESINTKK